MPANYRPITLLPIMYKLFSRILRARVQQVLEEAQSPDQAGFRSGYSCDDHLLTMVLLLENCDEFNLPLWACALDYQKAFDTVSHADLWKALEEQGVPVSYIVVLQKLYSNQIGRVMGKAISKPFAIRRG
eukprot:8371484-Karenia_brevis.AAC.1